MTYRRVLVAAVAISLFLLPISAQQSRVTGPRGRTVPRTTNSQAVSAPAVSPDIVISQVYGGGGNSGATYTNDFIEIFNLSTSAVSVNGWTVQYASATGGSWTTTALTGTIQPGAHYLIQEAAGAGGTTGLPTPDATGSIAMASAAGKVALVTNATALTCGATNNCTSASIRDLVGYGTTATAWEGSAPTANLTNTTAAIRLSNGCVDTDSNSADFTTSGAPNPRNTASSPTPCSSSNSPTGVGSASPNNPAAGAAVTITVTVTPGTNPASTGTTVVADLTSIGGLQGQSLYDDGTNGDVTAGDNIFTFATIVAAGTSGGVKTIPFTVNDSLDRATTGNFQLTVQGTSNPSGTGSANPNTVAAGGSTTLTVTVTPGALPASTGIAVTANLSSIGGSASQTFTDGGSNTFTFPATVSAGTANGAKTLPFTITDAQGRSGGGNISLVVGTNTDPSRATPAEHEVMGNPDGSSNTDNDHWLIERPQYVESYNCSKGIPNWVEWHLDNTWTGSVTRQNNYRADTAPPLPTSNCYIVQGNDYSGSGFDRGHNVPSADRQDTIADNSSTFLMPNFIPQAPNNNQITWNNMEDYIRTQIQSGANEAYIWMGNAGQGGVGSNSTAVVNTVANGHVVVPAYVWKVVMILPTGGSDLSRVDTNTRVFAALTPNVQSGSGLNGNWQTYICPVSKIEQLTGLNFFPNVPTATAAVLKSKIDSAIAPQTVASGTMTNLTLAYPETYMTGNITINGNLDLGPETLNTTNTAGNTNYTITLAPGATVTRMSSGMVTGNLEKQYTTAPSSFTYPVGTLNGYSPITANLTAINGASSLAVKAVQGVEPNANPQSTALQRYWVLTETGDLTSNLTFNYLDADVPSGTPETSLHLNKWTTFWSQPPATVDTVNNVVTTTQPVSVFSDWTLLPLATTAADVSVSGRAFAADGSALRGVRVALSDASGHTFNAITNAFGYYSFENVPSGASYLLNGSARGHVFTPRVVTVSDQLTNVDLTALP